MHAVKSEFALIFHHRSGSKTDMQPDDVMAVSVHCKVFFFGSTWKINLKPETYICGKMYARGTPPPCVGHCVTGSSGILLSHLGDV